MQKNINGAMVDLTSEEEQDVLVRVQQGKVDMAAIMAATDERQAKITAFKANKKPSLDDVIEMIKILLKE